LNPLPEKQGARYKIAVIATPIGKALLLEAAGMINTAF